MQSPVQTHGSSIARRRAQSNSDPWQQLRASSRKMRISIGCVSLIAACALCSCVGGSLGAGNNATAGNQAYIVTNDSTNAPTQVATLAPTPTPTATPTPTPTPAPTPTPTPKPAPPAPKPAPTPPPPPPPPAPTGVNGNPWGYNFTPGNLIFNPPANFCSYFKCIPSFWQSTNGYVMECADQTYSHSGGRSGSCSHHGGNLRPLYSH